MTRIKLLNEIKQTRRDSGISPGWYVKTTSYQSNFVKRDLILSMPDSELRLPMNKDFPVGTGFAHQIPYDANTVRNVSLASILPNTNFKLTTFMVKSDNNKSYTLPFMKQADEDTNTTINEKDYLFCLGLNVPNPSYKIVSIKTDACIVRDYIDTKRGYAAIVAKISGDQQNQVVNVVFSSERENQTIEAQYFLDKSSETINKQENTFTGSVPTEFISFPNRFIKRSSKTNAPVQQSSDEIVHTPPTPAPKQNTGKKIHKNKFNKK